MLPPPVRPHWQSTEMLGRTACLLRPTLAKLAGEGRIARVSKRRRNRPDQRLRSNISPVCVPPPLLRGFYRRHADGILVWWVMESPSDILQRIQDENLNQIGKEMLRWREKAMNLHYTVETMRQYFVFDQKSRTWTAHITEAEAEDIRLGRFLRTGRVE